MGGSKVADARARQITRDCVEVAVDVANRLLAMQSRGLFAQILEFFENLVKSDLKKVFEFKFS